MFESASFWRVTSASATKMHRNAEMCHLAVSREGKRRGKVHKESCGEREREREVKTEATEEEEEERG